MMNPSHHVFDGDELVASIIRIGNGRPASPVRFVPYWSLSRHHLARVDFPTRADATCAAVKQCKKPRIVRA